MKSVFHAKKLFRSLLFLPLLATFSFPAYSQTYGRYVNVPVPYSNVIHPEREQGDCETGTDPLMRGEATLFVSSDQSSLLVNMFYRTWEDDGDFSNGSVSRRNQLVWQAPPGEMIQSLGQDGNYQVTWKVREIDYTRNTPTNYDPGVSTDSPTIFSPWLFRLEARTHGGDYVGCSGAPHASMQLVPRSGSSTIRVHLVPRR